MTLEELQKIIGQQTSGLQLKMPVRETNPNYEYDNMGQPIIPEFRKHIPNRALQIGADTLNKTRNFYNTGNNIIGDILVGSGGDALESMAYGYKPKVENLLDLGLLGVSPFFAGVKGLEKGAKGINKALKFIPENSLNKLDMDTVFKRRASDDFVPLQNTYKNRADTLGGRKIDTDIARELMPEYNKGSILERMFGLGGSRYRSNDIHEGASQFSKLNFDDLLGNPVQKGISDKVTFTAGGAGVGKTSSLLKLPKNKQPDLLSKVFYDTNLTDSKKAIEKIDAAIKSNTGKTPVDIFYVNRNPVSSFESIIGRTKRQTQKLGSGRIVNIDAAKETHLGSQKAITELMKHYKNNDLVNFKIIDNNTKIPKISSLDKLPKPLKPEVLESKFMDLLTKARKNEEIGQDAYTKMLNGRADPLAIKPENGYFAGDILYGF